MSKKITLAMQPTNYGYFVFSCGKKVPVYSPLDIIANMPPLCKYKLHTPLHWRQSTFRGGGVPSIDIYKLRFRY